MNDLISRQQAIDAIDKRFDNIPMEQTAEILMLRKDLRGLPTIQPVATDTNVGNNSEIPNSSDCISRQAAIDAIVNCTNCGDEKTLRAYVAKHSLANGWTGGVLEAIDAIEDLPTIQPEPHYDEWCTGCKEYDQKRHNCPRWNKVIRQTLKDIEPHEGHWIEGKIYRDVIECYCSECGQLMTTAASVRMNYCPNCGAKMKGAAT